MEITVKPVTAKYPGIPDNPSVAEFKRVLAELPRPWRFSIDGVLKDFIANFDKWLGRSSTTGTVNVGVTYSFVTGEALPKSS